jgi:hypothetical protein
MPKLEHLVDREGASTARSTGSSLSGSPCATTLA